eukprot:m51a1_g14229 hypothetical protein (443) ;mRNA; f:204803-209263
MGNKHSVNAAASALAAREPELSDSRLMPVPPPSSPPCLLLVLDLNGVVFSRGHGQLQLNAFAELFFRVASTLPRVSVAFWTAADADTAKAEVEKLQATVGNPFRTDGEKPFAVNPLFVWDQSRCEVPHTAASGEARGKPLFLKPVGAVWREYPRFGGNVVIVDHSAEKLMLNPPWSRVVVKDFMKACKHKNGLILLTETLVAMKRRGREESVSSFLAELRDVRRNSKAEAVGVVRSIVHESYSNPVRQMSYFAWQDLLPTPSPPSGCDYDDGDCISGDSAVLACQQGWTSVRSVEPGQLLWTGLWDSAGAPVFRELLRKIEMPGPEDGQRQVLFVELAPGCLVTGKHVVFWGGQWTSAGRAAFFDRSLTVRPMAGCSFYLLELDGHEDVVCVGGVLVAAVGFFYGDQRRWVCIVFNPVYHIAFKNKDGKATTLKPLTHYFSG